MDTPVVVRFAPSPTGPPHLGSLRTALFNWLLARATGGRFILRIEDTDRTRYNAASEAQISDALRWLGLDWDEGPDIGGPHAPYRQSERLALYQDAAEKLLAEGHAYRPDAREALIRLKVPAGRRTVVQDAVRGPITFDYDHVPQDPVLIRSDGYPTYHLAAVVDDHEMAVTHVLRGEEWIPSTPLHLLIYEALGWQVPVYAHLPLVTDRQGQKLRKRDPRSIALVYREQGFLPEAVMNYLALLGWHPGSEEEVFTPADLVARFSLERLSKAPAAYDEERLRWFNRQHIARLPADRLTAQAVPHLQKAYPGAAGRDGRWLRMLVEAVRDELVTLADIVPAARFAFESSPPTDAARQTLQSEQAAPVLEAFREVLAGAAALDPESSAALLKDLRQRFKQSHGWGGRAVMFPLRAALTGSLEGPHLSDVLALLGKDEALARLDRAQSL